MAPVGKCIGILRIYVQCLLIQLRWIAPKESIPLPKKNSPADMRQKVSFSHSGRVRGPTLKNRLDLVDDIAELLAVLHVTTLHPSHRQVLLQNLHLRSLAILSAHQFKKLPS